MKKVEYSDSILFIYDNLTDDISIIADIAFIDGKDLVMLLFRDPYRGGFKKLEDDLLKNTELQEHTFLLDKGILFIMSPADHRDFMDYLCEIITKSLTLL